MGDRVGNASGPVVDGGKEIEETEGTYLGIRSRPSSQDPIRQPQQCNTAITPRAPRSPARTANSSSIKLSRKFIPAEKAKPDFAQPAILSQTMAPETIRCRNLSPAKPAATPELPSPEASLHFDVQCWEFDVSSRHSRQATTDRCSPPPDLGLRMTRGAPPIFCQDLHTDPISTDPISCVKICTLTPFPDPISHFPFPISHFPTVPCGHGANSACPCRSAPFGLHRDS